MTANQRSFEEARSLVLTLGWNTTCYQLLNAGIDHWWTTDRQGLIGYVRSGKTAIVAGAPVCAEQNLRHTIMQWEQFVSDQGMEACYFGAEARLQSFLADSPEYAQVVLGAQPEWSPTQFVASIEGDSSLRAQLNRAKNKGVRVSEWGPEQAEGNPRLRAVLKDWLQTRGLPTLHFLVEPETLGNLRDRRIFVAELGGEPVGFVTLCPFPAQSGWLTEQFIRSTKAPNGTVELMLHHAARAVSLSSESFSMGIVPLVSPENNTLASEPGWLRVMRRWARSHYTRFYNFRGLSEFKSKFHPVRWQPVVVVVKDSRFRIRHLRSIGRAFTQSAPELALLRGVVKEFRAGVRSSLKSSQTGR